MKRSLLALLLLMGGWVAVAGQTPADQKLKSQLKQLFPAAGAFTPKEGNPPHVTAFTLDRSGMRTPVGFAFWTNDLQPLERGYDGPIKMLVGMDPQGVLTGVIVVEHHEPFGDFSIERPEFAAQFRGKNIRDEFKVGVDIDAVTRATISVTSATRAVRNSSRRIARELLNPEGGIK
jgi:NosR/NirI family nitrous oxide reductase transcriptional regulator